MSTVFNDHGTHVLSLNITRSSFIP